MILGDPLTDGKSDIFLKVKLGSSQKQWPSRAFSFPFWGYPSLGPSAKSPPPSPQKNGWIRQWTRGALEEVRQE